MSKAAVLHLDERKRSTLVFETPTRLDALHLIKLAAKSDLLGWALPKEMMFWAPTSVTAYLGRAYERMRRVKDRARKRRLAAQDSE